MQSSSYKNVNDPPTISFSKPVKIEHFYVKRQTLKHPNQDDVFKFKIRAYLNNVNVYTFVV
jgi:hypothetical protein